MLILDSGLGSGFFQGGCGKEAITSTGSRIKLEPNLNRSDISFNAECGTVPRVVKATGNAVMRAQL